MLSRWNYPTNIVFGEGAIMQLSNSLQAIGCRKPLFVCDEFLQSLDFFKQLPIDMGVTFNQFKSNPDDLNVNAGVDCYRKNQCDGVVAIGGGSALDTAKTIALMSGQTRSLWDFIDDGDNYKRADANKIAPIIAIPTTAGTGSDVGRAAMIVNNKTHAKHLIFHPKLMASQVICDPLLTLSMPAHLTAATGMDALAHCLEAYFAPGFHPMADGIALEGARFIKESLVTAYENGKDLTARTNLMAAATMGGCAFQKGLGMIHALSHPVGGLYDVHHGLLNAIFMPSVLVFNRDVIEERCVLLARYLGLSSFDFDGVYEWVSLLNQSLKIPDNLDEIGVDDGKTNLIAELAMQDPSAVGNPKPFTIEDCKYLLRGLIRKD